MVSVSGMNGMDNGLNVGELRPNGLRSDIILVIRVEPFNSES
jgi:hypothetical protein